MLLSTAQAEANGAAANGRKAGDGTVHAKQNAC